MSFLVCPLAYISLLAKSPLTIGGRSVSVEEFVDKTEDDSILDQQILVTNLPEDIEYDDIKLFFENKRKFDKTFPDSIEFNEDDSTAVLTYNSSKGLWFICILIYIVEGDETSNEYCLYKY